MLEVRSITKRYPAVTALDGVSLAFAVGTSHAVIGENGAGKSTLMKILAGVEQPTEGEVLLDGAPVRFRSVREAAQAGIAMIHQELNLVDELNAAENVFLGREPRRGFAIDRKKAEQEAERWLHEVRAPFGPRTRVGDLSVAGKQLVEIAKAVSQQARYLILDEPTAVLSERETDALFDLLGRLHGQGVTLIYISHLLDEVLRLCDVVSVLRDGQHVETRPTAGSSPAELAKLMVGRDLGDVFPPKAHPAEANPILEVENLQVPGWVRGLGLTVRPGEILGLAGLVGSGRTEACEAIVGLRAHTGDTRLGGESVRLRNPREALRHGVAYLSEDRKGAGLVLGMSAVENTTLANLRAYGGFTIDRGRQRRATDAWIQALDVRVGDPEEPVGTLSGGNQQKVALAKWLDGKPRVLLLDEPTRGVDVGAKREIYRLVHRLASEGLACVLVSSEMPELVGLCHRVVVMRDGRSVGELVGDEIGEHAIMLLAAGVEEAA
ncbi:MAG: sugar ABC transporter ATP-binding protein [Fimbriimonadaceae bacterium]|nr:sugar ABC transporter ATP-binding protein [Fimbriimonadaceae bacterium]